MKAQSQATIHFSGYPLRITEVNQKPGKANLTLVKSSSYSQLPTSLKSLVTNDPQSWDVAWFNNYE